MKGWVEMTLVKIRNQSILAENLTKEKELETPLQQPGELAWVDESGLTPQPEKMGEKAEQIKSIFLLMCMGLP